MYTLSVELDCIRKVSQLQENWRLSNCTLYTTLEPCPMCMGAIQTARIKRVVFGAFSSQTHENADGSRNSEIPTNVNVGNTESGNNKYTVGTNKYSPAVTIIGGVLEAEAVTLLKRFFKQKREKT